MAGPNPDWTIPDPTVNNKFADLDAMREDIWPTFVGAALHAGAVVPGWDLTAETHDSDNRPLTLTWANQDSPPQQFKVTYTYTGVKLSTARFQWDYGAGSGFEDWTQDTATLTIDDDLVITSITWA